MNIVRVSSKECHLNFSLNDPNIKIKTNYINGEELNKNDLGRPDRDVYVEWRIQPPEYSIFFTSLLYCAKNGLFEKESVEYFKNILDIQEQISTRQNFLEEKFINNRPITDLLNEINDDYLQKNDGFPSSDGQEVAYLFFSRVTSNGEKIILSMIFDEKENNLLGFSIFFYSKEETSIKNNEICLPLDATLAIVWLNMCKLFLYASKETREAITAKLEEIKLIVDEIEKLRSFIKESFALNLEECYISKDIEAENAYIISPFLSTKYDKQILIDTIKNPDAFNQYNLTFMYCIFNDIISMTMKFTKEMHFIGCTFKQIVSFKESEFQEEVSFRVTTFEDVANFQLVQFHKDADFSGVTFKKMALFSMDTFKYLYDGTPAASCFKKKALFTNSIFEHNVSFVDVIFYGDTDFDCANFQDKQYKAVYRGTNFSGAQFQKEVKFNSIFGQDVNFNRVIFKHNANFSGAEFREKANFISSKLCEGAFFYEVIFQKIPNFFQAIFKESINFTNTKLDFGFPDMQQRIETYYTDEQKSSFHLKQDGTMGTYKEEEYKIANEFRDSFRTIKSALIKDNNMIDASNYHRVELYCKELELEYKREEKAKTFWENFKFILNNGKDFVDEIQLYCYRLTSDHHTNLLLILNHIIFLIALFYIANLGLTLCAIDSNFENIAKISNIKIREIYIVSLFVGLAVCFIFNCFNQITSTIICICMLITCVCFFPCFVYFLNVERCSTILYCVALLLLACACVLRCLNRNYAFLCPYPIVLVMLFSNPSSILPILGKLIENKSAETCLLVIGKVKILCWSGASFASETLNLIYMLFLFLLLWSLQKTARKNTIVPS